MLPATRTVPPTKFHKKWRIAGIAVNASLLLVKRIFSKNGNLNSQVSYIALDSSSSPTIVDDETKCREIVKSKNLPELQNMGDVQGIAKLLETNPENGINGDDDDLRERRMKFDSNTYKKPPVKGLIHFVVQGFMDNIILILLAAGLVNLVFGILVYGLQDGWYDGGSTIIVVVLLVLVSAGCKFRQTGQLDKLQKKMGDNISFDVVRNGKRVKVSVFDLVVGDVVFLNVGDHVPADGLFIDGYGYPLVVDEPNMNGESVRVDINSNHNPFLLSGSTVAHGFSKMLVVGIDMTYWGQKTMSITNDSNEQTPLQERVEYLTSTTRKIGLLVGLVILVALLIRFIAEKKVKNEYGYLEFESLEQYIFYIIYSVAGLVSEAMSIVVAAVPGGLDLAFMIVLANTLRRMMADHILVRKLSACETMGSTTVICTNKTGTLTLNDKKVTKLWIGNEEMVQDFSQVIAPHLLELLHQGVAFNTTCSVYEPHEMEKAILSWAVKDLGMDIEKTNQDYAILGVEVFNSRKKQSGVHIRSKTDDSSYVHRKGAAEIVLAMCSYYYEPTGELRSIGETERSRIQNIIEGMQSSRLQCVAFAYRKMKPMATESLSDQDEKTSVFGDLSEKDLTLLGIIGIKDSSRPNTRKGTQICRVAGVDIKLITSDNLFAAKAVASDCGILESNQQVDVEEAIEGIEFRSYTAKERLDKVDKIRIMANSSPSDKRLMVQCLKQKGHVVAVTRDGTNDADMLKEADTVLSMGIQGIETAKERQQTRDSIRSTASLYFAKLLMILCIKEIGHVAVEGGNNDILSTGIELVRENSDIVILNDDFSSVTTVLKWGRCIYCNVQKYIQFQLTFNIVIVVIYLIAAFSGHNLSLTNFQLLWADLIMEKLGAFALATERPDEELMLNPPIAETEPIITNVMWRNMLAQALYQISVLLTLQFHGMSILKVDERVRDALFFNTLVLFQVFNLFNSRKLEKKNVFEGIHKSTLFLVATGIIIFLQFVMIEYLRFLSDTVRLSLVHWGISVAIAFMGLPIGLVVKLVQVPKKPFLGYFSCIETLPALSDELLGYFEVASEIKNEVVEVLP